MCGLQDGFGIINTERGEIKGVDLREGGGGVKEVVARILQRLREFSTSQRYKVSPSMVTLEQSHLARKERRGVSKLRPGLVQTRPPPRHRG